MRQVLSYVEGMNDRIKRENEAYENAKDGVDKKPNRNRKEGIVTTKYNQSGGRNVHVRIDDDTPFDEVINAVGALSYIKPTIIKK